MRTIEELRIAFFEIDKHKPFKTYEDEVMRAMRQVYENRTRDIYDLSNEYLGHDFTSDTAYERIIRSAMQWARNEQSRND